MPNYPYHLKRGGPVVRILINLVVGPNFTPHWIEANFNQGCVTNRHFY
jgi:hypothetical protein